MPDIKIHLHRDQATITPLTQLGVKWLSANFDDFDVPNHAPLFRHRDVIEDIIAQMFKDGLQVEF